MKNLKNLYFIIATLISFNLFAETYSIQELKEGNREIINEFNLLDSLNLKRLSSERNDLIKKRLNDIGIDYHNDILEIYFSDFNELHVNSLKKFFHFIYSNEVRLTKNLKYLKSEIIKKVISYYLNDYLSKLESHKTNKNKVFELLKQDVFKNTSYINKNDLELNFKYIYLTYFNDNADVLIRNSSIHQPIIRDINFKGIIRYNAAQCSNHEQNINNKLYNQNFGRKCKPRGSHRKWGRATAYLIIYQKNNFSNRSYYLSVNSSMEVTGGYACQYLRVNCGGKTSVSSIKYNGSTIIPTCNDLYSCPPALFERKNMRGKINISLGKSRKRILRFKDYKLSVTYDNKIKHKGSSGAKKSNERVSYSLMTSPNKEYSFSNLKNRSNGTLDFRSKISILLNIKYDHFKIYKLYKYVNDLRKRTEKNPSFQDIELEELYKILYLNDLILKTMNSVEGQYLYNLIKDSLSRRIYKVRFVSLKKEVQSAIDQYKDIISSYDNVLKTIKAYEKNSVALSEIIEIYPELFKDEDNIFFDNQSVKEFITFKMENSMSIQLNKIKELVLEYNLFVDKNEFQEYLY